MHLPKSYLTNYQSDGTCVRDYLHVLDLASGHLLALNALASDSKVFEPNSNAGRFKAYNLGKGKGMSVIDILEAMRKATGFDYKYEIIGRRFDCTFLDTQASITDENNSKL